MFTIMAHLQQELAFIRIETRLRRSSRALSTCVRGVAAVNAIRRYTSGHIQQPI